LINIAVKNDNANKTNLIDQVLFIITINDFISYLNVRLLFAVTSIAVQLKTLLLISSFLFYRMVNWENNNISKGNS